MINRCIMVIPEFENGGAIDNIRNKYDPLADHVRPHITLVFPFESEIPTDDLRKHISANISGIAPFELVLSGISPVESYLFLNIVKGGNEIVELHKRLYTGILENYFPEWLKEKAFLPHMTVGNFDNDDAFKKRFMRPRIFPIHSGLL